MRGFTLFAMALGSLWEIAEWAYDSVAPTDVIRGKDRTMADLVLDLAGALAAALVLMPVER